MATSRLPLVGGKRGWMDQCGNVPAAKGNHLPGGGGLWE